MPYRRILLPLLLVAPLAATPLVASESESGDEAAEATPAERPFLGVHVNERREGGGLIIRRVVQFSTAAAIGLEAGDVLLAINGSATNDRHGLAAVLGEMQVGDELHIAYLHDEQPQKVTTQIKGRPQAGEIDQQIGDLRRELGAGTTESGGLGASLDRFSAALGALPQQLQQAADEFKTIYPDGEFTVDLDIRIRSGPDEDPRQLDLSPTAGQRTLVTDSELAVALANAFLAGRGSSTGDDVSDFDAASTTLVDDGATWLVTIPTAAQEQLRLRIERSSGATQIADQPAPDVKTDIETEAEADQGDSNDSDDQSDAADER